MSSVTPRDHIYLIGELGHILAFTAYPEADLTSIYAIIKISLTDEPITSTLNGEVYRQAAIVTRPAHTKLRHHGVNGIAFVIYPRHPLYRAVNATPPPGIVPVNRLYFTQFATSFKSLASGDATIEAARSVFDAVCKSVGELLPPPNELDPHVAMALELLHADYRCPAEELAKLADLPKEELELLFLRDVGINAEHYKLALQFGETARQYNPGMSLAELACKIGFRDEAQFADVFTQVHGAPPSYFLAQCDIHV